MITTICSGFGVIAVILGCTWHMSGRLAALETAVDTIKNNDLHSIEGRLENIEKALMRR